MVKCDVHRKQGKSSKESIFLCFRIFCVVSVDGYTLFVVCNRKIQRLLINVTRLVDVYSDRVEIGRTGMN